MRKLDVKNIGALNSFWKKEVRRSEYSRFFHRLHCVKLVASGFSCYDVAKWFDETARSIERWVRNFDDFGVEGLREDDIPGRPRKLNWDQYAQLSHDLQKPPYSFGVRATRWNGVLLAGYISNQFGVSLSIRQCQRILVDLKDKQNYGTTGIN